VIAELATGLLLATAAGPCRAPLPLGPSVPATIVFKTSCGGFQVAKDGTVRRLPRHWFARHAGGTGRRYGAELKVRRNRAGRIWLVRHGRVIWRSSRVYPRTADTVAFGPHAFAFNDYYRGVFMTDLERSERLVVRGRGRFPHEFFDSGRLIVTGGRTITVLSPGGLPERRYPYERSGGYAFDGETNTLFFVTPRRRLATVREARLRVGRRLDFHGMITLTESGRLLFYGTRSLTLATRDGRRTTHARWAKSRFDGLDSGAAVSGDGRLLAFRLSDAKPGARQGTAILYLRRAGEARTRPVYRHALGPIGCGVGANMRWHDRHLLYSSPDGQVAIIDAAGKRGDLTQLAKALPRRARTERPVVAWRADYAG
jgi:hypothetical protein